MPERLNILVVDDEPLNQALLEALLEDMGHTAVLASSGEEGLAKFMQQLPDVVLMDVMMPGVGGFEAVRAMRRATSQWLPIIFITSLSQVDDMVLGIEAGADDYLLKPLNRELLRVKINNLHAQQLLHKKLANHNRSLMEFSEKAIDDSQIAQDFIRKVTSLDTINDPDVQFYLHPAENYSGDLIAFGRTPSGQLHVMLADSTGHGLAAALNVMPILQPFYAMTAKGFSLGKIIGEINRTLKNYLPQHRFVAAVFVMIDPDKQMLQVWNGGLPPATLLGGDGSVAHAFDSSSLPLGILGQEEFDAGAEQFFYGNNNYQLFLCTDGAVDTVAPGADMLRGMQVLLDAARHEHAEQRLSMIQQVVNQHLHGRPALDDVALMMLRCGGEGKDDAASVSRKLSGGVEAMQHQREIIAPALQHAEAFDWQVQLQLTSAQLRKTDVIPLLMLLVNNMETQHSNLSSSLFVTLSELFNNALDHGVLKLDSALKEDPAGMEMYFEERARRLQNLEQGEINIRLEKFSAGDNAFLKVVFRDSGEGFDYAARLAAPLDDESLLRHGRGIALMQSLCYSLRYLGKGNEVEAILLL